CARETARRATPAAERAVRLRSGARRHCSQLTHLDDSTTASGAILPHHPFASPTGIAATVTSSAVVRAGLPVGRCRPRHHCGGGGPWPPRPPEPWRGTARC